MKCVNCSSPSHEADCEACPEFQAMKRFLKTAITLGISVREARAQLSRPYSQVSHNAKRFPQSPLANQFPPIGPTPPDKVNIQLAALQAEIKLIREITIPGMNETIRSLSTDLEETKKKLRILIPGLTP